MNPKRFIGQSRKNLLIGKNPGIPEILEKIPEETLAKYPGAIETVERSSTRNH